MSIFAGKCSKPMKRFVYFLFVALAAACQPARQLEPASWDPAVRESLNELMASAKGGYAVFDFDKTTIVNDISQAVWVYQIEHLCYADAPAHLFLDGVPDPDRLLPGTDVSFAQTGKVLQVEYKMMRAWKNLDKTWAQIRDTELYLDFRARMYSLLVGLDQVFGPSVSYLWMPGLLAGFTEEQARAVVHEAILEHQGQEKLGVQSWISPDGLWGGPVERGIYLSPEMKDLYRCLTDNGVDAYICSASLELIVETLACDPQLGLGLPPERVFGLRFVPEQPLTAIFDSTYVQPIGPGKVTCIETFIAPSYKGGGPVLVSGDSNGDVPMLTAFPDTRHGLVIDVGRKASSPIGALAEEARSTDNQGKYLLQPVFVPVPDAIEGGGI